MQSQGPGLVCPRFARLASTGVALRSTEGVIVEVLAMYRWTASSLLSAVAWVLLASAATVVAAEDAGGDGSSPDVDLVRTHVLRYFSGLPGYRPGDLISQSQVKPLLGQLTKLGLELPDPKALLARVPADGSFLARELRTRQGREFMRHLGGTPQAYDRMERVSQMKRGQQTVRELIARGRKGADVFDYFANQPDGKKAGKLMAQRGQSSNFNQQTGKIYTVDQLLAELKKLQPPKAETGESAKKSPPRVSNPRAAQPATAPGGSSGS
jgi:hypothetical protein